MNKVSHLGSYGLIIKNEQIVLINKANGPYKGKLDLPGGTIEFGETPEQALIREIKEEVGIDIEKYSLSDGNSTVITWKHNDIPEQLHHIGFFYKIENYHNEIKSKVEITKQNDDSLGANFYNINELKKSDLSEIAILEIEKLGYKLN
ncbi:nUDIX hydrolase [Firmicutes bacterium CAG:822]|nr:nUDIX hydrolase [Firmicutes bacterium CAG:822]